METQRTIGRIEQLLIKAGAAKPALALRRMASQMSGVKSPRALFLNRG
jgi:hypothetical protein